MVQPAATLCYTGKTGLCMCCSCLFVQALYCQLQGAVLLWHHHWQVQLCAESPCCCLQRWQSWLTRPGCGTSRCAHHHVFCAVP
jgi:hypothetical protein